MKFSDPRLCYFNDDILKIAETYHLNTDELVIESYIPRNSAIFVESIDGNQFRVHINLQENRIISAKQLNANRVDRAKFKKYTEYMK